MSNPTSVYVFNATPNPVSLNLNGNPVGSSINQIQVTTGYAPQSVSIFRNPSSGSPGEAQFGGKNTLIIDFEGNISVTYSVSIDPNQYPLTQDLQLYIFTNQLVLVSPSGDAQNITGKPSINQGNSDSQ